MPLNPDIANDNISVIIVILIIKTLKQLYVGKGQLTLLQSLARTVRYFLIDNLLSG
jgi:hypothetical protein